jgi:hypothetical protein
MDENLTGEFNFTFTFQDVYICHDFASRVLIVFVKAEKY